MQRIRGNRASPLYFLLGGLVLVIVGLLLVLAAFGSVAEAFESGEYPQNATVLLPIGVLSFLLGMLAFAIWLIAFAVSVGLVETNRRLDLLNRDMHEIKSAGRQQLYSPSSAPGLHGLGESY